MGAYSLRLPIGAIPSEFFADLPRHVRTFLRNGLIIFNRVNPQYSEVLLSLPVDALVSNTPAPQAKELATMLAISPNDARSLLAALSFLALVATSPSEPEPVETTSAALVREDLLDKSGQPAVERLLTHYQQERGKVSSAFRKVALTTKVLPSLDDYDFAIDVRLDFDKEQPALAVPIVVGHIDTDAPHQEVWFQMSKAQTEKLVEDLKKIVAHLEQAEKWMQTRT
jgi:hypothetical protein